MRRFAHGAGWSGGALLLTAFYFVWAAPRLGAIIANPLAYDDFYIGTKSPQDLIQLGSAVYLYSWRPVQYLEYRLFDTLLSPFGKPFVFTVLPKLIGGLFLSIAATLAYRALRRCEVARPVAFLCLAVFVVHPVVNEITLWNSVHARHLLRSVLRCLATVSWPTAICRTVSRSRVPARCLQC